MNAQHQDTAMTDAAVSIKEGLGRALAEELKRHDKAWGLLSEFDQSASLDRLEEAVSDLIADAVEAIACRGFPHVRLGLEKVTFTSKGAQVTGTTSRRAPGIHDLADLAGSDAIIVTADANEFLEGAWPEPERDQRELELDGWAPQQGDLVVVKAATSCRYTGLLVEEGTTGMVEEVLEGLAKVDLDGVKDGVVQVEVGVLGPAEVLEELDTADGPGDWVAGDVCLVGANRTRGTVVEVVDENTVRVETELDGTTHSTMFPIASIHRPGGDA